MKPAEFKEIKERFEKDQKRWESLNIGDTVYDEQPRFIEFDYHEAVIKEINIEERYIKAHDLSVQHHTPNKIITLYSFVTEEEFQKK